MTEEKQTLEQTTRVEVFQGEIERSPEYAEFDAFFRFSEARARLAGLLNQTREVVAVRHHEASTASAKSVGELKRAQGTELRLESLKELGLSVLVYDYDNDDVREITDQEYESGMGGLIAYKEDPQSEKDSAYRPVGTLSGKRIEHGDVEDPGITWRFPLGEARLQAETPSVDDVLLYKLVTDVKPTRSNIESFTQAIAERIKHVNSKLSTNGSFESVHRYTAEKDYLEGLLEENQGLLSKEVSVGAEDEFFYDAFGIENQEEKTAFMQEISKELKASGIGSFSPEYGDNMGEVPSVPMEGDMLKVGENLAKITRVIQSTLEKFGKRARFVDILDTAITPDEHPYVQMIARVLQFDIDQYPKGQRNARKFLREFRLFPEEEIVQKEASAFSCAADHMHFGKLGGNEQLMIEYLSPAIGHSANAVAALGVSSNGRLINGFCSSQNERPFAFRTLASAGMHDVALSSNNAEGVKWQAKALSEGKVGTPTRAGATMVNGDNLVRSFMHSPLDRIRREMYTYEVTRASANKFSMEALLFDGRIDTQLIKEAVLDGYFDQLPKEFYGELPPAKLQENVELLAKDPYASFETASGEMMTTAEFYTSKKDFLMSLFRQDETKQQEISMYYDRLIRMSTPPESDQNLAEYFGFRGDVDWTEILILETDEDIIQRLSESWDPQNDKFLVGNLGDQVQREWQRRGHEVLVRGREDVDLDDEDLEKYQSHTDAHDLLDIVDIAVMFHSEMRLGKVA